MSIFARTLEAMGMRKRAPAAMTSKVIPSLSLWTQFTRIGGGITPSELSNIMREADNGNMRRLLDLGNDARQKDCHLHAVLSQSEEAIAGLSWELALPDDARAKEKKVAAWVESTLRETPSFHRLLAHQGGSFFYSHAVSEITWAKDGDMLIPACFESLDARRFGYRQVDGTFVWRDLGMSLDGVDFLAQYPDKFVVSRPRVTGDVPCREGLIRVLCACRADRRASHEPDGPRRQQPPRDGGHELRQQVGEHPPRRPRHRPAGPDE